MYKESDQMRIPERYKQTIYIANETYYGSGDYEEPYALRCMVSPKSDRVILGGGVSSEMNYVDLQFESRLKGVENITQNSHVWIKRKPDPELEGADFTHEITGRASTAHDWFVIIEAKNVKGNTPII